MAETCDEETAALVALLLPSALGQKRKEKKAVTSQFKR